VHSLVATTLSVMVTQVCAVLALRLRMRSQLRQSLARHYYVVALARTLPQGSRLREQDGDGSGFDLTIAGSAGVAAPTGLAPSTASTPSIASVAPVGPRGPGDCVPGDCVPDDRDEGVDR
jgi:hypothetical protein